MLNASLQGEEVLDNRWGLALQDSRLPTAVNQKPGDSGPLEGKLLQANQVGR